MADLFVLVFFVPFLSLFVGFIEEGFDIFNYYSN